MVARQYIPDRGDLVWVNLNPRQGHEQAGHRPAVVLSPNRYNNRTGLCVIFPATRQLKLKGYALELHVVASGKVEGVVLADHVRSIDWRARNVRLIQRIDQAVLGEIVAKLEALIIHPADE
jgi:mRNA interferase MazF